MPKSKGRRKPGPNRRRPTGPARWLLDEAIATTALAVSTQHEGRLTAEQAMTIARTAVGAAVRCLPDLANSGAKFATGEQLTDPREAGGDIVTAVEDPDTGVGARNGSLMDIRRAVLLDTVQVLMGDVGSAEDPAGTERPPTWCVQLAGRLNQSTDRASILWLTDTVGAGHLIAELLALAMRAGPVLNQALAGEVNRHLAEITQPEERTE